ncbi:hypothetical protein [Bacteroides sp.]|uniref:hypothetical protein n=1 Tax=Bacteroides sp. TaxID=29523 RepID=UPI00261FB36C|nr:hypothetical protein [Bacteroides sp.]MDD3039589.1 hypothetical protein [Bacteroides sp.]
MSNVFQGSDYEPLTVVQSAPVNEDFAQIREDLITHLALLRIAWNKLDTITPGAGGDLTAYEITYLINHATYVIDQNNLFSQVGTISSLNSYVSQHLSNTQWASMHPLTSIQGLTTTYSTTPTGFVTATTRSMLDEINNLRYQLYRIIGKSTWVSTPANTLNGINTAISNIHINQIKVNTRLVTSNSTITNTDAIILVDGSVSNITLTLPSLADTSLQGAMFHIINTASSTHAITLQRGADPDRVDGSSSQTLGPTDNIIVVGDCTTNKWWILGSY